MDSKLESNVIVEYIHELQKAFSDIVFKRLEKTGDRYITSSITESSSNDVKIFTETQVKRSLVNTFSSFMSNTIKNKLSYFSQGEDDDIIYKHDNSDNLNVEDKYAVQNVGHATQLIQVPGFNILTDPVFYDLNCVLYPAKTSSYPPVEQLPKVDIVIISHNHPDHIDKCSLQSILKEHERKGWLIPLVFVPMGDKKLLQSFGFKQVEEVEWFTKISVIKGDDTVHLVSIPADHRSGRYGLDHHKSLVCGWIINPEQSEVIFKYSGDTRALTDENQKAIDGVLWHEIQQKVETVSSNGNKVIPDIICFEPSGPNYTRCDMDVTHQSASYSILLKFIEAENLAKLSNKTPQDFIQKIKTIMMHHNKFELGPDRFNEGLFIFKKLLSYLTLSNEELNQELHRQQDKFVHNLDRERLKKNMTIFSRPLIATLPSKTSILAHSKDFIINDIFKVSDKIKSLDEVQVKKYFLEYLTKNTVFPKIGERCNSRQMRTAEFLPKNVSKYNKKSEKIDLE